MASKANLEAATRTDTGKGAARALRRQGRVPGVVYGHGREPAAITVEGLALQKTLQVLAGATTLVDLSLDGQAPVKVLVREIQRNPVKPIEVLHLDLHEVRTDEKVTLEAQVRLIGTADGVRNFGGVLDQVLHTLTIRVFPQDIPEHIDLDVTALTIGHSLFVRDVSVPKVEILNDPSLPICSVVGARAEETPTPVAEPTTAEPELIRKPKPEAEDEGEK